MNLILCKGSRRGRDRMVVGFTTQMRLTRYNIIR